MDPHGRSLFLSAGSSVAPHVSAPPTPFTRLSTELGGVINNHGPRFKASLHLVDGNRITEEWSHKTWVFEGWWCESIDSSVSIWSVHHAHICQEEEGKNTRKTNRASLLVLFEQIQKRRNTWILKHEAETATLADNDQWRRLTSLHPHVLF